MKRFDDFSKTSNRLSNLSLIRRLGYRLRSIFHRARVSRNDSPLIYILVDALAPIVEGEVDGRSESMWAGLLAVQQRRARLRQGVGQGPRKYLPANGMDNIEVSRANGITLDKARDRPNETRILSKFAIGNYYSGVTIYGASRGRRVIVLSYGTWRRPITHLPRLH